MGRDAVMKALVTGGGGFIGGAIARRLLGRGDEVRSFSRRDYPELRSLGIETRRGDLADAEAVSEACGGVDVVFHAGAKAGVWGPLEEYRRANVEGTRNVLAACRRHRVPRLVFTSSPSVVFNGRDMEGINEKFPYPEHFEAPYPETKAEAERLVLAADGRDLATVALRPHLVWGPGDNHLVPRLLARARGGSLRRVSGPAKLVDATYIDNAVDAHLAAADRLAPGSAVAGKAYFISQGEPVPLWDLVDRILGAAGAPPVTRTISPRAAYAAAWLLELAYKGLRLAGEPPMTRFAARELSTAHWFDLSAARKDLGYAPRVDLDEGLRRLAAHLRGEPALAAPEKRPQERRPLRPHRIGKHHKITPTRHST